MISKHVSGLAPLLVALIAYALATMAIRSCDVAEDDAPPLFTGVGMDQKTCEVCGRSGEQREMPFFFAAGDDQTKRYCCADTLCRGAARRWICWGMPAMEKAA